ncbi:MAG: GNAT family N-acetyltransferase [Culicoidibacterales bacterium]
MIRKAKYSDIDTVVKLILMASRCVFEDALKTNDEQQHEHLLRLFYNTNGTKFSCEHVHVYEQNGSVVGCIVAYDTSEEERLNSNMNQLVNTDYQFEQEGIEDTFYIDSVAVDENARGGGIAKQLIQSIIRDSDKNVSLLVESYKIDVMAYYARLGFQLLEQRTLLGTTLHPMIYIKNSKIKN